MSTSPTERLIDMPPSAKLVFVVLDRNGPLTQREICDESLLAARTVRYALNRLEDEDLINREILLRDARKHTYSLSGPGEAVTSPQRKRSDTP